MSVGGVSMLDLPSVRGNPFDNRPIEASRAHDLVGRQKILHRWKDHILSGSPRMILLVGESGSGRTSMINTISSQTPKKYIGQFLSDDDDQVRTVLHEIVTHFGSFQPIPTMNQLSQKLVSILDEEKGPLPLIALDYPFRAIDINIFLSRISPILLRLRAMIIVTITESQLLELDLELKEMFDEPDRIPSFTKKEIQEMVNNRMRIKSKEKWNINSKILESIHSSTGGNPRDVIKILKCLVDEKRELGSDGTLENLMAWQNQTSPSTESKAVSFPSTIEGNKVEIIPIINSEASSIEDLIEEDDDFIDDEEPLDMWEEAEEEEEEEEESVKTVIDLGEDTINELNEVCNDINDPVNFITDIIEEIKEEKLDSENDEKINTEKELLNDNQSMRIEARERENRLREISLKLRTPSGLSKLENEPAFKRNNIDLEDTSHSSEDDISHYTLTESDDEKLILKDNNPYLHDNVD